MRRRPRDVAPGAVPVELGRFSYRQVIADLRARGEPFDFDVVHRTSHERRRAAQQWCEARSLSFCMTFLGWQRPSPSEVAAGCTRRAGDDG